MFSVDWATKYPAFSKEIILRYPTIFKTLHLMIQTWAVGRKTHSSYCPDRNKTVWQWNIGDSSYNSKQQTWSRNNKLMGFSVTPARYGICYCVCSVFLPLCSWMTNIRFHCVLLDFIFISNNVFGKLGRKSGKNIGMWLSNLTR